MHTVEENPEQLDLGWDIPVAKTKRKKPVAANEVSAVQDADEMAEEARVSRTSYLQLSALLSHVVALDMLEGGLSSKRRISQLARTGRGDRTRHFS